LVNYLTEIVDLIKRILHFLMTLILTVNSGLSYEYGMCSIETGSKMKRVTDL